MTWCVANQRNGIEQYFHTALLITESPFSLCMESLSGHNSSKMVYTKLIADNAFKLS